MQKFPVFLCHSITKVWRRRKARVIKKLYLCWNGFEIWSAWIHELVLFKRGDSFGKLPFYKSSTETKTFYISKKTKSPAETKAFYISTTNHDHKSKNFPICQRPIYILTEKFFFLLTINLKIVFQETISLFLAPKLKNHAFA